MIKGIDVSKHNGAIKWEKTKEVIDFAMLRAGYGKNNIDAKFKYNADECTRLSIPFGVYWFSYAYTPDMARKEADYCLQAIKPYKLLYPVCFDFEYDSFSYARQNGKTLKSDDIVTLCRSFLDRIEESGYYAMNYANSDYLNYYGMKKLTERYDLWYAYPEKEKPNRSCGIWQSSFKGKIAGITGKVDTNIAYKNYPEIMAAIKKEEQIKEKPINQEQTFDEYAKTRYEEVAKRILNGDFGNGQERKVKLINAGYDYKLAQKMVKEIL